MVLTARGGTSMVLVRYTGGGEKKEKNYNKIFIIRFTSVPVNINPVFLLFFFYFLWLITRSRYDVKTTAFVLI